MIFNITRASRVFEEDTPPCEGCVKKEKSELWKIEIKDLDELLKLTEKEGSIIIYPGKSDKPPVIVLYDDYVE